MNLTLWTYQPGTTLGQKELFYEIINEKFTQPDTPSTLNYQITSDNPIQSTSADISVTIGSVGQVPLINEYLELKLNDHLTGLIDLPDLLTEIEPDTSYEFYFFPRIDLLIGKKLVTDYVQVVDLGATQVTNEYADYYGYEWAKVHSDS